MSNPNPIIGYHTSVSGSKKAQLLENEIKMNNSNGFPYLVNLYQIFLGSPRSLYSPNISTKQCTDLNSCVLENKITLFSHAPYVLNLAKCPSKEADYVAKICKRALDDMRIIKSIGGVGSVFHIGKHLKMPKEEAINNMYTNIKTVLDNMSLETHGYFILETAAGQGTELITKIPELGSFYHRFSDEDRKKMKVCIDTCHVFAVGYELSSSNDMNNFINLVEEHINWSNVALIHLNDSKKECKSCKDRHANICKGHIWSKDKSGLKTLVNYATKYQIPMVLETPLKDSVKDHNDELRLLFDLVDNNQLE